MPERVQLRRTKGWRMPENTVKVDRSTKWGNPHPWRAEKGYFGNRWNSDAHARACAREVFRDIVRRGDFAALADIEELRGKNLACWCPLDEPCHADVLLELANK